MKEQIKDNILWELKKHNMTVDNDTLNIMIKAREDYLAAFVTGIDITEEEYNSSINQPWKTHQDPTSIEKCNNYFKEKGYTINDLWFDNISWPKFRGFQELQRTTLNNIWKEKKENDNTK